MRETRGEKGDLDKGVLEEGGADKTYKREDVGMEEIRQKRRKSEGINGGEQNRGED